MASDNGDQDNQPWPGPAQQQPESSPWAPRPEPATPPGDQPEDATVARPVGSPPPPAGDDDGDVPTTGYGQVQPPAAPPPAPMGPPAPSSDDERTQAFARSDVRIDQPHPVPTQQMPVFPPPSPGVPYQPQPAYPPPPAYPPAGPYQPEQSPYGPPHAAAPAWPQQPPMPGYGQPAYPQPYGAPPQPGYGPYGQPPYSPYPPGPPRKRRVGPWVGAAVVVVLAVLAVVAFVAKPGFLGFKKVLDHTAVEKTIEQGGYTNVKCNDGKNPKVKKGATFTCIADGGTKVTVTITSDGGNYAWSPSS
jgi:hypothetical protein